MSRAVCFIGRKIVQQDLTSRKEKQKRDFEQHIESRKLQAEVKVLTGKVARLEGDEKTCRKFNCWKMKRLEYVDRDAHKRRADALGGGECCLEGGG